MRTRTLLSIPACLVLAASCKDGSRTLLERFEDAYNGQVGAACVCDVQVGEYPDEAACREDYGPAFDPDVDRNCANKVFNDSAYKPWVQCTLQANQAYADCLKAEPCPTSFTCADGSDTIPESWKCDGDMDCTDGSDEAGCPPPFMCADGSDTVPDAWHCDGEADCTDGSDEADCDGVPQSCDAKYAQASDECGSAPETFFDELDQCIRMRACANGEQIRESWWCDGEPDCTDESDEANC